MRILHNTIMAALCGCLLAGGCSAKTPDTKNQSNAKKDTAVSAVSTASTTAPAKYDTAAPEKTVLFFMNPNGRPCQMQETILIGMKEKLGRLAQIKYVQTTEPADRAAFSKYGIRGLPSLILVDKEGRELTRFPPGIQSEETILAATQKKNGGK